MMTMMRVLMLSGMILSFPFVVNVYGQDYPTTGLVYNTRENSSIVYDCNKSANESRLNCKLTQTSIRKKAKPEDRGARLANAKKQFAAALKDLEDPQTCQFMTKFMAAIKGTLNPEAVLEGEERKDINRKEFLEQLASIRTKYQSDPETIGPFEELVRFCREKDEKSYLAIAEAEFERDLKTCTVGPNSFEQSFVWSNGNWVVDEGPQGECGIVQLSRFESEKSSALKGYRFWNYIAQKAVTNPGGETLVGKCEQLDQSEYRYSWKKPESVHLGCAWIEFSPF
jgi:hypothetical protein